jgi:hypothetical protein
MNDHGADDRGRHDDDEQLARLIGEAGRRDRDDSDDVDDPRLNIFRESAAEEPRPGVLRAMAIRDIALPELLDDLSETAAALRLREAA